MPVFAGLPPRRLMPPSFRYAASSFVVLLRYHAIDAAAVICRFRRESAKRLQRQSARRARFVYAVYATRCFYYI